MTTNQAFKNNIARFNKLQAALSEHGLSISGGVVVDDTLPVAMHKVVCSVEYRNIDLDSEINLEDFEEIHAYINGGRAKRIEKHENEQVKIREFFEQRA
ncbi:hypothetical protein ACXHQ0_15615 [Vibrio antiquarius]|uniref:Uncharacterized protein n=1 Tax=Vibrio parahaemolyticus TaxID=670 RepID=A0AA46US40_VIBPH|nr:hypothetical protein [Vibrio parahaemolyticus]UYV29719.1 hypothetical protein M5598_27455 [Vibrio parahaemolyticus]UYW19239.1 hypothetical protein IF561_28840 [Vibrio parahaemolyticus]